MTKTIYFTLQLMAITCFIAAGTGIIIAIVNLCTGNYGTTSSFSF